MITASGKVQISSKSQASSMRKEFDTKYGERCASCCNRQKKSKNENKMICIAYDNETAWDGFECACGLFNVPFRGLRPKRMPHGEYLKSLTKKQGKETNKTQTSLFTDV